MPHPLASLFLGLFLALPPAFANGQDMISSPAMPKAAASPAFPIIEFSSGFSMAHSDLGGPANMTGWHITFGMSPRRWLRLIGDFSHQEITSDKITYNGVRSRIKDSEFTWGPQFVYRRHPRVEPFAHSLFGVAARHYTVPSSTGPGGPDVFAHDFGFATVLGGGVDLKVHRAVALRLIQADVSLEHRNWVDAPYTPTIAQLPASGNWQARPRISCGVVVRLPPR